jgi:hypothetical protein
LPVSPSLIGAIRTHHDSPGRNGGVKHIAHLPNTANLLANQNKFANEIIPEATVPLEYSVLGKLDLGSEKLETLIENTKESLETSLAILKNN